MIRAVLSAGFCIAATGAAATCSIVAEDISARLSSAFEDRPVVASDLRDPDSSEPIRRYVTLLETGDVLVLDQRHCEIVNLVATVFSQSPQPSTATLAALSNAVMSTPEWQDLMQGADLEPRLATLMESGDAGPVHSLTDWAETINPAADIVVLHSASDIGAPFPAVTSVVIGIGGL